MKGGGLGFCEPLWHGSLGALGNNSCKNCFSSDLWADGAFIYKKGRKNSVIKLYLIPGVLPSGNPSCVSCVNPALLSSGDPTF